MLGEVSGEALASVVGLLVALQHALLGVGVGFSGLAFGGFGQVVQSLLAVLLVALNPLAHELWGGVARNYTTTKHREKQRDRLELKKYCPRSRKHTVHREAK